MMKNKWKRDFFTIWIGQAFSLITSSILQLAIIWYLTEKTGSAMVLSMATFVGFLPQAVLGPVIGVLIDRYDRKLIMIGADLIIAAAGAVLAVISVYMELPVWIIMIVLFVRSVGTAFHTPALSAAIPLLVPSGSLVKCNGYSQTLQSAGYLLGPAAAAVLYSVWSLNAIIALDVIGALIACAATALVAIPRLKSSDDRITQSNFLRELKEGYSALRKNKGLFALLWIGALYMLIYMPINALFPLMSMEYFGGTTIHASAVEITFAAGMLAGGLILGLWGGFKNRILTIGASIFLMGCSLAVSGLLPVNAFIVFTVCSGLMGLSAPFYGVQTALFQERIEPEYLGRVFSLQGSIMSVAMPLGLILSGILTDRIGVNIWFLLSGILIIGIAFLCMLIPSIKRLNNNEE